MTPAIRFLKQQNTPHTVHTYVIEKPTNNYGQDAADALSVPHHQLFKTLLISLNGNSRDMAVCIIPVNQTLNLKKAAACFNAKKASMADPTLAEKATGYVVGGISPFGQKKSLPVAIDISAQSLGTLFCSGGKRGLQVELAPAALINALAAQTAQLTDADL
jgi:Cys-tRNA(Pro)/Cys-tRNA(Cys) deacylase